LNDEVEREKRIDYTTTLEGERRSLYTQIGQKARVQEQARNGRKERTNHRERKELSEGKGNGRTKGKIA
jgi:hypothetical protein